MYQTWRSYKPGRLNDVIDNTSSVAVITTYKRVLHGVHLLQQLQRLQQTTVTLVDFAVSYWPVTGCSLST